MHALRGRFVFIWVVHWFAVVLTRWLVPGAGKFQDQPGQSKCLDCIVGKFTNDLTDKKAWSVSIHQHCLLHELTGFLVCCAAKFAVPVPTPLHDFSLLD